jgi:hypothetical protein
VARAILRAGKGVLTIRVVSLVRLTDEGMRQLETFGEVVAKVRETETNWAGPWSTSGRRRAL